MKKTRKYLILIAIFLILAITAWYLIFSKKNIVNTEHAPFADIQSVWVDSLIEHMSIEQKIGNLIIYDIGTLDSNKLELLDYLISKYHIGSVAFETDSVCSYVEIINKYQSTTGIPLFICSNNKTSFPNYLNDIVQFPNENALQAISTDSLINNYINTVANIDKTLNINFSILPSYLSNEKHINAFKDKNIIAGFTNNSIYNFENDTSIYSNIDKQYKDLINRGISAIYLNKDIELDTLNNENYFLSNYLTEELGHKGLIITDIKNNILSTVNNFKNSSADMLLVNKKLTEIIDNLKDQIATNELPIEEINNRVKKILLAKSWTGAESFKKIDADTIKQELNSVYLKGFSRKLFEASLTIVRNQKNILPVKNISSKYFVYSFGEKTPHFKTLIKYYVEHKARHLEFDSVSVQKIYFHQEYLNYIITLNNIEPDTFALNYLNKTIKWQKNKSNIIIVNFGNPDICKHLPDCPNIIQVYGNSKTEQELACQLVFGGIKSNGKLPQCIKIDNYKCIRTNKVRLGYTIPEEFGFNTDSILKIDSIINDALSHRAFPGCQVFIAKKGKVIFNKSYGYHTYDRKTKVKWNDLYDIASITKVAGTTLASMKMVDQGKLKLSDKLEEYFKNTKIEYTKIKPDTIVRIDTINIKSYRNAKKFIEEKDTIHIDDSIVVVYDTLFFKVTPKLNIFKRCVSELLIHKSGLPPSMPILRYILYKEDTNIVLPDTFIVDIDSIIVFDSLPNRKDTLSYLYNKYYTNKKIGDTSGVQIAKNFYLRRQFEDTLWIDTKQIRVYSKSVYMYSDVNPIILQQAIDTINEYGINKYLEKYFFKSLGLKTIGYLPLKRFKRNRITPTEHDKYWRNQVIHGYVHDPSAALLGGIAGNAGLFSNAHDLGVIFQMLLNGGTYGRRRYISNKTINKFTAFQPGSHRGLGFDKALEKNIIAFDAPANSYGHTGFTGCCVWVDPKEELVYVFLSNRVHPSVKNWKLNTLKVRQKVHQVVYDEVKRLK